MKIKAIVQFRDLEAKTIRNISDEFEVSEERFNELEIRGFVKSVEESPVGKAKPVKRKSRKV